MNNKKEHSFLEKKWWLIIAAVFCNILWGSAFPAIKIGYSLFQIESDAWESQMLFAGCRFALAGILALIAGSCIQHRFLKLNAEIVPYVLKLSLFQTILQYVFFYVALAHITGVKASIIESTNVFFAILFSYFFLHGEKGMRSKLLWCIPGFIGVILVNLNGASLSFDFAWNGEGFIILSTLAAAFATVLLKKYSVHFDPVTLTSWQFFFGGVVMAMIGYALGGRLNPVSANAWLLIFYLAFVSAAAYSIWGLLLKYHPVSKVSVFSFTNPIFGVLLSSLLLHESLSVSPYILLLSLLLVCIGIYGVNRS